MCSLMLVPIVKHPFKDILQYRFRQNSVLQFMPSFLQTFFMNAFLKKFRSVQE